MPLGIDCAEPTSRGPKRFCSASLGYRDKQAMGGFQNIYVVPGREWRSQERQTWPPRPCDWPRQVLSRSLPSKLPIPFIFQFPQGRGDKDTFDFVEVSEEAQTPLPGSVTVRENMTWTVAGRDCGAVWPCDNNDADDTDGYQLLGTYYYQI